MVGKQGFIRTMEAVIAILLVLGFLLYILPKQPVLAESVIPEGMDSVRNYILTEFSTNRTIRECVSLVSNYGNCIKQATYSRSNCYKVVESLLDKHTPAEFEFHCEICPEVKPCTDLYKSHPDVMKKSVYPGSVFIYLDEFNVKYARIYFWRR